MGQVIELRIGMYTISYVDTKIDEIVDLPKAVIANNMLFLPVSEHVYLLTEYTDYGKILGLARSKVNAREQQSS